MSDLKYGIKNFDELLSAFYNYIKKNFPDNVNNFRDPQIARALLEILAYNGDLLQTYQDAQYREVVVNENTSLSTLYKIAYQNGAKLKGKTSSICKDVVVSVTVPAIKNDTTGQYEPNTKYLPRISEATFVDENGISFFPVSFEVNFHNLDLTRNVNYFVVSNDANGNAAYFRVEQKIDVIGGTLKTYQTDVINIYEPFKQIDLPDENVADIINIIDSDGEKWYEVDNLLQDKVGYFEYDYVNKEYNLKYIYTNKKFISVYEPNTDLTTLTFGRGLNSNDYLIPELKQRTLPIFGKQTLNDFQVVTEDLFYNDNYGISPYNISFSMKYIIGVGAEGNSGVGTINSVDYANFEFYYSDIDTTETTKVKNSLAVNNINKATGGRDKFTQTELTYVIPKFIKYKKTLEHPEDFASFIYSMPSVLGTISKLNVVYSSDYDSIDVYVLSENTDGSLTTADTYLKNNIIDYIRYKTDKVVNVKDAQIVNLQIKFDLLLDENKVVNQYMILNNVIDYVTNYFSVNNMQIGNKINKEDLRNKIMMQFKEVISVPNLFFTNITTSEYNSLFIEGFNLSSYITDKQIYAPYNVIYELKFPKKDIVAKII